ncbi:hypothetical protein ACI79C_01880 [Geodermatophilus sp. SYSU D00697]
MTAVPDRIARRDHRAGTAGAPGGRSAAGIRPDARPPGWVPVRPTAADLARQVRDVAADLPRFALAPLVRPWHRRWGATRAEVAAPMPGDEVFPRAQLRATRAITIAARPGEVWPWLVQVGCLRAGWYADDLLDNLGRPSARRIVPELQDLAVGSWLPMAPRPTAGTSFVIDSFQTPEWMLWRTPSSTWAWRLLPLPGGRTRLVARLRFAYDWRHPAGIVLLELGDWPMMRRMLRGIRERAEAEHRRRVPPSRHPAPADGHQGGAHRGLGVDRVLRQLPAVVRSSVAAATGARPRSSPGSAWSPPQTGCAVR